jgi:TetR/AcrR family transcriptional regulator, acrAB operon repressor
MSKCEYVDDFAEVLQQILNNCTGLVEKYERKYHEAQKLGLLNTNHDPKQLAMDTHLFFTGLLHLWVKDTEGTYFRNQADKLVKAHIGLRRK